MGQSLGANGASHRQGTCGIVEVHRYGEDYGVLYTGEVLPTQSSELYTILSDIGTVVSDFPDHVGTNGSVIDRLSFCSSLGFASEIGLL